MALNKQDRIEVAKVAAQNGKSKEIKFTPSGGSVYVGTTRCTDRGQATRRLNED